MGHSKKLLFVCTGNVCRSLLAEKLLNKLSADKGLSWVARSCGVAAQRDFEVPAEIRAILKREGVREFTHTAQLVSRDLLRWADLALTLTEKHRLIVLDRFPEFRGKVHVLRGHVGLPEPDVEDPIGLDEEAYAKSAGRLRALRNPRRPAPP